MFNYAENLIHFIIFESFWGRKKGSSCTYRTVFQPNFYSVDFSLWPYFSPRKAVMCEVSITFSAKPFIPKRRNLTGNLESFIPISLQQFLTSGTGQNSRDPKCQHQYPGPPIKSSVVLKYFIFLMLKNFWIPGATHWHVTILDSILYLTNVSKHSLILIWDHGLHHSCPEFPVSLTFDSIISF